MVQFPKQGPSSREKGAPSTGRGAGAPPRVGPDACGPGAARHALVPLAPAGGPSQGWRADTKRDVNLLTPSYLLACSP